MDDHDHDDVAVDDNDDDGTTEEGGDDDEDDQGGGGGERRKEQPPPPQVKIMMMMMMPKAAVKRIIVPTNQCFSFTPYPTWIRCMDYGRLEGKPFVGNSLRPSLEMVSNRFEIKAPTRIGNRME